MYLYNSLTRTKEEFVPHEPGKVKMYTCGPTVYHYAHIGNLRSYIMEDVLEKYLRYLGYDVKRVMNITDVGHLSSDADTGEDKMLKGAKREHKSVMEIAKFYTDAFFEDCKALNIKVPDVVEPATNCIPEFIAMVQRLLDKGYAYVAGGNVYFDTSKLKQYYVFGEHDEENLAVGVREGVEADGNKKNKTDFVLWFTKSKFEDQELKWESPWGMGYPGWHIECSAISLKHLGEYMDIHCGGIDNAFPHHTNEIAQSEAKTGKTFANYWMHNGFVNVDNEKMSKSLGNFVTVHDMLQTVDGQVLRFFLATQQYRKPINFTEKAIHDAEVNLKYLKNTHSLPLTEQVNQAELQTYLDAFQEAMDDDFNTANGVTVLFDMAKWINSGNYDQTVKDAFEKMLQVFGIVFEEEVLDEDIEKLIEERQAARANKDFATADRIRDELAAQGIKLLDTKEGVRWTRD